MLIFDELVCFFLEDVLVRKIIAILQLGAEVRLDSVFVGQSQSLQVLSCSGREATVVVQILKPWRQCDLSVGRD